MARYTITLDAKTLNEAPRFAPGEFVARMAHKAEREMRERTERERVRRLFPDCELVEVPAGFGDMLFGMTEYKLVPRGGELRSRTSHPKVPTG